MFWNSWNAFVTANSDDRLAETLESLSPEQTEELQSHLLMQGENRSGILQEDLKRSG